MSLWVGKIPLCLPVRLGFAPVKSGQPSNLSSGFFWRVQNTRVCHLMNGSSATCDSFASGGYAGLSRRSIVLCAEQRPKAAATQRAAPTARRLGCHLRNDQIFQGLGQHKALQIQPWIAAPRPDAARLRANIDPPQRPPSSHGVSCVRRQTLACARPCGHPAKVTPNSGLKSAPCCMHIHQPEP